MTRGRSAATWDGRIERARELAVETPAAREALTFYAALAGWQRRLFLHARPAPPGGPFADAVDLESASAAVPDFVTWLQASAPVRLAEAAAKMTAGHAELRSLLRKRLSRNEAEPAALEHAWEFVIDAVLQPVAEAAAANRRGELIGEPVRGPSGPPAARCPVCGDLPGLGVLREEGHGAKRLLLCGCCLTEWEHLRLVCAACGEERFDALPVFTADDFPQARIEACDTCRQYLKTIDLTRNALAVPVVDDIASTPLDLWAGEQGYRRLRANLLRTHDPALRAER